MTYEKPEIEKIITVTVKEVAMDVDGCSTKWSGCCWKD